MNGFVPRQTFGSKTSHSTNDRIGVFGNLIFNDDMKDRMDLQVRQLDTGTAMVFFGELNSRLLIERKPLLWVWCLVRVVTVHDADSEVIPLHTTHRAWTSLANLIPAAKSMTRWRPSQMVFTPGSPSPLRARKPPSMATRRTTSLSLGGVLGTFFRFRI